MKWITPFIFLVFIILIDTAFAVGISDSNQNRHLFFEPNKEFEFTFTLLGQGDLEPVLQGPAAKYATVTDDSGKKGERAIKLILTLPPTMEEGVHKLTIGAQQKIQETGTISVRPSVRIPIYITVLKSVPYIKTDLSINDANLDENITIRLGVQSWTYADIESLSANVKIYDLNDKLIKDDINLNHGLLKSKERISIIQSMAPDFLDVGHYKANASVTYAQNVSYTNNAEFRIGSLELSIINHTKTFLTGEKISRFDLTIESNWNHRISDVYAKVSVQDEQFQTPTVAVLEPFSQAVLTGYWTPNANETGEYSAVVQLYFDGGAPITRHITVQVIDEAQPKSWLNTITMTFALVAVIIMVIIIDIIWLMKKKK